MAALTAPAQANSNLRALNNSAFSRFSAADQALMRVQVDKAIAAEAEGQSFDWKSDKSRASGVVTPLARGKFRGMECRNLRIQNSWGNQRDEGVFRFCQQPSGQWGLVGPVQD
jgi:surface antigen